MGFRSKEYNIYQGELNRSRNSSKFVKSFYEKRDGLNDIAQIFIENSLDSNYFISGPPLMIKLFKNTLIDNGVPAQNVLTDDWE